MATNALQTRVSSDISVPEDFIRFLHTSVEFSLQQLASECAAILRRTHGLAQLSAAAAPISNPANAAEEIYQILQLARRLGATVSAFDGALHERRDRHLCTQQAFLSTAHRQPAGLFADDHESVLREMQGAMHASCVIICAQGMNLVALAARHLPWSLPVAHLVEMWRQNGGTAAGVLTSLTLALEQTPHLNNILDDDDLSEEVMKYQESLRHAVARATRAEITVPVAMACLDYLDSHRGAWLPVNLVQVFDLPVRPPRPPGLARH